MIQYDRVLATFQPVRTDDLQPGVAAWIGRRLPWCAVFVVESGPYEGQWAMGPLDGLEDGNRFPAAWWVPLCDLADVVGA
jgi:hypothetical protein